VAGLICAGLARLAFASGDGGSSHALNLTDLSLEQLMDMDVTVTSVSKKDTRVFTSPAAIYVISQEDIRNMGVTSLPEALRMAPGINVAQINSDQWAVSARGFNSEFATNLLVLIDGRTIYTPASSGVFWDAQNVMMEDIERIEIIRGPGATLWGANAVNGVVNIITKGAQDTQGGLAALNYGNLDQPITMLRYGGQLAPTLYYRVYGQYADYPSFKTSSGADARDESHFAHGGFRLDYEASAQNNFNLQGDYYAGAAGRQVDQVTLAPATTLPIHSEELDEGANVLGRWTHIFTPDSQLAVQTYFDHVEQGDGFGEEYRNTLDVDAQYRFALGTRNVMVLGGGYR
jgi:iron complex outermembrane recepter protein